MAPLAVLPDPDLKAPLPESASLDVAPVMIEPRANELADPEMVIPFTPQADINEAALPAPQPKLKADAWQPWERMAIVAGIFMVLAAIFFGISGFVPIVYYMLSFAFMTGTVGLIMGFKHDRKGKGLALGAVLFAIVMAVLALNGYDLDR
jgi:hypothetical protein